MHKISFTVNEGEILSFLGPSGGGKTSLIKCIYGLEDVDSGEIIFNGQKVTGPSQNLIPGHPDMKLVSQDYYVLDNHTVEENIKDILIGFTNEYKEERSTKLLNLLELKPLKQLKAKNLSSGQKQRVAIARALASFPKLLLLDEPFSNLDKILKDKLFHFIIKEAYKQKSAVILITHQAEEALKYTNKIGVMLNGKILQIGDRNAMYYNSKNLKAAKILGDYNILNYKEFESGSLYYKKHKKIFLRPNQFEMLNTKKGCDLVVSYITHFFNGKCYEILAQTKSGADFIFYSPKVPAKENNLLLKIIH